MLTAREKGQTRALFIPCVRRGSQRTAIRVFVEEPESGSRLLGPACENEIFVFQGSVLGVPDTEKWKEVRSSGVSTGISYLSAVAFLAAARIERAVACGRPETVQVKMAKLPSDINVRIHEYAMRYITDNRRRWT